MIEIDGKLVARWMLNVATESNLNELIGVEFSDADGIFIVEEVSLRGVVAQIEGTKDRARLSVAMLEHGTFFADESKTGLVRQIEMSRSPVDVMIDDAKQRLSALGFAVSEMGGDTRVLKIAQIHQEFSGNNLYPEPNDWHLAHEIFSTSGLKNMMLGAQMTERWLDSIEKGLAGRYDIYYRNMLTALYRNSGKTTDALRVSEIVNASPSLFQSGGVPEAMIRVTRAATIMDGIERNIFSDNVGAIEKAKRNLDKAYAIFRGDSEEAKHCYYRLDALKKKVLSRVNVS